MLITKQNYQSEEIKNYFDSQAKIYIKKNHGFNNYIADLLAGDMDWNWECTDEEGKNLDQMCAIAWISNDGDRQECVDYFKEPVEEQSHQESWMKQLMEDILNGVESA